MSDDTINVFGADEDAMPDLTALMATSMESCKLIACSIVAAGIMAQGDCNVPRNCAENAFDTVTELEKKIKAERGE